MRMMIALLNNNIDNNNNINDKNNNDNYCHPPDAISASIKRSSKIESLPRSLPH